MAAFQAIEAVTEGFARHLKRAWELGGLDALSCDFKAVGTKDFKLLKDESATCAISLYRVTHNEFTRNQPQVAAARPVTVDLHLLFSVWLDTASREQAVLGWLLRELGRYPVVDRGLLASTGGFAASDRLQFVPAELSLDDTAKLWQLFNAQYRPSVTYVVRNVQIGPETAQEFAPVAATRFEHRDEVPEAAP